VLGWLIPIRNYGCEKSAYADIIEIFWLNLNPTLARKVIDAGNTELSPKYKNVRELKYMIT
jgi:hypothetical protein